MSGSLTFSSGISSSGNSGTFTFGTGTATSGKGGDFKITVGKGNTAAGGEITVVAGESTGGDGAISFTTGHDKDGSTTGGFTAKTQVGQIQEILS